MYGPFMRWQLLGLVLLCGCPQDVETARLPSDDATLESDAGTKSHPTKPKLPPESKTRFSEEVRLITAFVADDKPPTPEDTKVEEAVRTLGKAHVDEPLSREEKTTIFTLFRRLQAHTVKAKHRGLYRTLNYALVAIADPRWESDLITMLEVPIASSQRSQLKPMMDQVYWQVTAAEILGKLRSKKAVGPLIKTVLSPFKANVAVTSMAALARIGKPVVEPVVKMLEGTATDLNRYAEAEFRRAEVDQGKSAAADDERAKRSHLHYAVLILGNLGSEEAKKPLLAAARSETKWLRQLAAEKLPLLPKDAALIEAFKRVYEETSVADKFPDNTYAKERLIESAGLFFEPGLAAWVLADVQKLEGTKGDVDAVKATALAYALRAADQRTWPEVERLYADVKAASKGPTLKHYEEAHAGAKALLDKCGDEASCHAKALNAAGPEPMPAVRAAYMLTLLGGTAQKAEIVKHALATKNNSVRMTLAAAIITLSPKGDVKTARALEGAYESAKAARDQPRIASLKPLLQVAAVLRMRAEK
jgi:hypothetical protein